MPRKVPVAVVKPAESMRIAAYIRVSTDEQKQSGLGLGDQRVMCASMAMVKGWPEPTVFADEGISGTLDESKRPALARLMEAVRSGEYDAVIVRDLSRIARKTQLILYLVDQMQRNGVAFVSCKESVDTATATGTFFLTILAALAQLERDLVSERTVAALKERERRDGEHGGKLPYGYVRSTEGVQVDPEAAKMVRRIFRWRNKGMALRAIAEKVQAMDTPAPRGARWHHTTVAWVLANQAAYKGGLRGKSTVKWPKII